MSFGSVVLDAVAGIEALATFNLTARALIYRTRPRATHTFHLKPTTAGRVSLYPRLFAYKFKKARATGPQDRNSSTEPSLEKSSFKDPILITWLLSSHIEFRSIVRLIYLYV